MKAARLLAVFLLTLATFLAVDFFWLGVVARGLYTRELGHLLAPSVRWGAAALFYVLYVAGLLALVVLPNRRGRWLRVVDRGALLGLVAYATYDLTNLATLPEWPLLVTVVDLAWGAVVTGVSAGAAWWFARRLLP